MKVMKKLLIVGTGVCLRKVADNLFVFVVKPTKSNAVFLFQFFESKKYC